MILRCTGILNAIHVFVFSKEVTRAPKYKHGAQLNDKENAILEERIGVGNRKIAVMAQKQRKKIPQYNLLNM